VSEWRSESRRRRCPCLLTSGIRRLPVALAAVTLLGIVAAGCGIPNDDKPRALDPNVLPASLAANPSGTSVPTDRSTQTVKLYLVQNSGDREVLMAETTSMSLVSDSSQLPGMVIRALIAEQPPATASGGNALINALPPSVQVLDASLDGTVLNLDLSDLGNVELTRQRQAAAQIVFTATALTGIESVRFHINGQPIAVPLDNETSVAGQPVTRSDYPRLMPTN
jgi:spore germination protein GerM